jgi:MFS superfamily sulfate permease-like transporter
MTTISEPHSPDADVTPPRQGIVPNIISGLATGLFSIPEGMAYAQLAGVNPVYGFVFRHCYYDCGLVEHGHDLDD